MREGDEVLVVGPVQREADVGGQAGSYRDAPSKLVLRPGSHGLAAVRDVSSLARYAAPTLIVTTLVVGATLAAMVAGGYAFVSVP